MAFSATHRHARMSARKVRPIADMIRGKYADDALDILRFQPQRGARLIEKVLRSALGNAADPDNPANKGQIPNVRDLVVSEIRIDGGPMMKRIRPRARGMAFMIRKRSSHIHVALEHASIVKAASQATNNSGAKRVATGRGANPKGTSPKGASRQGTSPQGAGAAEQAGGETTES